MCGRFTLTIPSYEELADTLGVSVSPELKASYKPRYNIAPTDPSWVLRMNHGVRELVGATWGLIPHWAKSAEGRAKAINARAESIEEAPKFRDSFARKRCVVVADGFFEWVTENGMRKPLWFTPAEGRLLFMAGVQASWLDPKTNERMRTFSVVTCAANDFIRPVHDRMPVVLAEKDLVTWMETPPSGEVTSAVRDLMRPAPIGFLRATRVSSRVNSVKNDDPSCILPGDDAEAPPAKAKPAPRTKAEPTSLSLFDEPSTKDTRHAAQKRH